MKTYEDLVLDLGEVPEKEPATNTGIIVSALTSVLIVVNEFWPHLLTDKQTIALYGVLASLAPIIAAFWIRSKVYAPATVQRMVDISAERAHAVYDDEHKIG